MTESHEHSEDEDRVSIEIGPWESLGSGLRHEFRVIEQVTYINGERAFWTRWTESREMETA